jgi:signal transduction histidine kinase/CheY-like chemotaxis protein
MLHPHSPILDLDHHDRVARSLAGQKRVLEMIALGDPLDEILSAITAMVESEGDGLLCTILTIDDTNHLRCAAVTSLPLGYNQAIDGEPIGPQAGSCGTAAYLQRRVIVEDIATDPLWDRYREVAIAHGLRACWSEPIIARDGTVVGTFAIYHTRPACPTPQHLELIESAAHLAGIALERQRSDDIMRRAKELAESANASKDQFLAVLSHELRTPLTPLLATVNLLEARSDLPSDVRFDLATIRRNVQMEARLIDDLLDLTRVARGKVELQHDVVDVHGILHNVIEICQNDLDAKKQQLTLGLWALRHHVWADAARLQQVFWNLLNNAIKFTPRAGKITITSENPASSSGSVGDDDELLVVRVTDTGIGIEPDVIPRLFTAFEQGQRRITRQFGGLGLGLTISKALLELQDGTLSAHSEGHGKGAAFTVTIPVVEQPVAESNLAPGKTKTTDGDGDGDRDSDAGAKRPATASRSILLVEDHADTLRAMNRLLASLGYTVHCATSVADAMELIDKQPFDLVISDLGLPDGSGLEIMRRLREVGHLANGTRAHKIRGIALSGFGMEDDVRKSEEAGFDRHITKPVAVELLEKTIRELWQ